MLKIDLTIKVREKLRPSQDLAREGFVVLSEHSTAPVCKSAHEAIGGCMEKTGLETPVLSCYNVLKTHQNGTKFPD